MLQIKTLLTGLTVICIASVCLAGLVTYMLWRETRRLRYHRKMAAMAPKAPALLGLPDGGDTP